MNSLLGLTLFCFCLGVLVEGSTIPDNCDLDCPFGQVMQDETEICECRPDPCDKLRVQGFECENVPDVDSDAEADEDAEGDEESDKTPTEETKRAAEEEERSVEKVTEAPANPEPTSAAKQKRRPPCCVTKWKWACKRRGCNQWGWKSFTKCHIAHCMEPFQANRAKRAAEEEERSVEKLTEAPANPEPTSAAKQKRRPPPPRPPCCVTKWKRVCKRWGCSRWGWKPFTKCHITQCIEPFKVKAH